MAFFNRFGVQNLVVSDLKVTDGDIVDANGNRSIALTSTADAVNYVTVTNAASGSSPEIECSGATANLNLSLKPKGTGGVRIYGTSASLYLNEDADNGTNFMGLRANPIIGTSHTYTWPAALPGSNLVLQSDNAGTLSWVAAGGGGDNNDLDLILHMQVFS